MLIKNLFKNANFCFATQIPDVSTYHKSQTSSLDTLLIKVSKTDQFIATISKVDAHLNANPDAIHRAFSLFIFDRTSRLLLQQRSDVKITFPGYWTNTCCSHPSNRNKERRVHGCGGVRLAATKRLKFEMGIRLDHPQRVFPVQKVYYQAKYDETWGENEVDYVLFAKLPFRYENKPEVRFNKNEVKAVHWIERGKIHAFLKEREEKGEKTTPWMKKILDYKLMQWWEAFETGALKGDLKQTVDLMV